MRVLILGHDPALSDGLRNFLLGDGHVVDCCSTLRQADTLANEPYDAWLFDGRLPDGSGVDWLRRMRSRGIGVPAVGITERDQVDERIRGPDCGADDFVVRPFAPEELCARLRAISRRVAGGGTTRRFGDVCLDFTARTAARQDAPVELTAREWALTEALALRAGRIVSKQDLEALVLGFDGSACSNTIEVHICKLRAKLGRGLIETVRGMGYRLRA